MEAAKDPTHGIPDDAFAHLSEQDRERIWRLPARTSERFYRRGVNQGVFLQINHPDRLPADIYGWRYGASLDKSPVAGHPAARRSGVSAEPSNHRLFAELSFSLQRVGLTMPDKDGTAGEAP